MTSGFRALRALDVAVGVDSEAPEVLALLDHAFADLLVEHADPEAVRVSVRAGAAGTWTVSSPAVSTSVPCGPALVSAVATALNLSVVAATPHLTLHGAVLTRDERVLAVLAASGTGKSTLTAALMQQGWGYVSDEALCLPPGDRGPLAYPRPLALSRWSLAALGLDPAGLVESEGEWLVRPGDLGADVEGYPSPVTDLVVLRRDSGTAPGLQPLAAREALTACLTRSFNAYRAGGQALVTLSNLVQAARTWVLDAGSPREDALRLARDLSGRDLAT